MSAHRVNILRDDMGDCTNNGMTSPDMAAGRTFYMITSLSDKEKIEKEWNKANEYRKNKRAKPVCLLLCEKNVFGKIYRYVQPTNISGQGMMGGNFIYSCDSRFREVSDYPLPVHDRVE